MSAMNKIMKVIDDWWGRIANGLAIWPFIPASVVALAAGYFSSGVNWINQLGNFGWLFSGLLAFFVTSSCFYLLAQTRILRIEARLRERVIGDSSPFDPMARVHENKRLYLRDLAPVGRRVVKGKKFINCEIVGPGTAVLGLRSSEAIPFPKMTNSQTFDVDCIEFDPKTQSALAVTFPDCDFEDCQFYHLTLLFMQRDNDTLNWITPDFRQLSLLSTGEHNE